MTPGASLGTETDEKWTQRMRQAWGFALSSLIWLTSCTQLTGSLLWERILSTAITARDRSVICQHIDLSPQLKTSSVTSLRWCQWCARSGWNPLFGHSLNRSTLFVWVNTWAFGLRPAFTSHLPLGKQVLMVPGEGIMRHPDEGSVRSGSGRGTQSSLCHSVMRDGDRGEEGGNVPNWVWKANTFMSCIKASPVQVVFWPETSGTSTPTHHVRSPRLKVKIQRGKKRFREAKGKTRVMLLLCRY